MPEAQSSKVPATGRTVRCPACGGESLFGLANAYRPFCSARCKGIDLGAWASERFRLSEGESSSAPDFEAG